MAMRIAMTIPCHCFKLHARESKSRVSLNTQHSCTGVVLPGCEGADAVDVGGEEDDDDSESNMEKITWSHFVTKQLDWVTYGTITIVHKI